ncbi:aromatic amino acid lyase [Paenibacillaceae bacterium]|nr:aromatic amino acid lyase [Paenibacillaceae bacterium]
MNTPLVISGSSLRMADIAAIVTGKGIDVTIATPQQETSERGRIALDRRQEAFSACGESLLPVLRDCVQYDGELLPTEIGLISIYLLLNHAAKEPALLNKEWVQRAQFLINHRIIPCIHKESMTELSAMGELALILYGEEELLCYYNSTYRPVGDVYREMGLSKLENTKEDVTFITNACCVSTAISIFSVLEASRLAKTADLCVAMHLEAIRGEIGAFDRRLHELGRPYANQIKVAENIRRLIAGSEFTTDRARAAYGGDNGPRIQDAISIRAVPQTHGGVRDTITWLQEQLADEINAVADKTNPLLGYLLDVLAIGLIDLGNVSERRSFRLLDSKLSYGLPMNLVGENPGFNHGFPVVQAAATGILAELKLLAASHAGMNRMNMLTSEYSCTTFSSALKSLQAISLLDKIIGIEMFMTAQGMDLAQAKLNHFEFGTGTSAALQALRQDVPMVKANRFASPDMVAAERAVAQGVVLQAVEHLIGELG